MLKMDNVTMCKYILSYFFKFYFTAIESENSRHAYGWENIETLN